MVIVIACAYVIAIFSGEESHFSLVSLNLCTCCLHVKKDCGFANENRCVWFSNVFFLCVWFFFSDEGPYTKHSNPSRPPDGALAIRRQSIPGTKHII